jgi:hypothetical protein
MIPSHFGVDGRASKKGEIVNDMHAMLAADNLGKKMVKLIATLNH